MADTEVSQDYLLACLDTTAGLIQLAAKNSSEDDDDDEPLVVDNTRSFGDTCNHPRITGITPSDEPSGEGCTRFYQLGEMMVNPDPRIALQGAFALVNLVTQAVNSLPKGQTFNIPSP